MTQVQIQTPKAPETSAEKALRLALATYDKLKYRDRSQFNNAEKLAYETLIDLKVFMKGQLEDESHTAGYYHLNLVILSTEVLRFWLDNNPK